MTPSAIVRYVIAGIAGLVVIVLGISAVTTVDTGHRGIKVRFGEVIGPPLPEGLYFVNPITTHVRQMDTRILKWDGKSFAYTKDVQQAVIYFTLNYRLDATQAADVYKNVGDDWANKLVGQVVHDQIKRVLGQYEAVELIAKRNEATNTITADITTVLATKSVVVTGFQITNIDYTPEFERAVEAKVVAQQEAIREQNHTVQIEQQAKQKVITAEAEAKSMQIRAQALESNPKLVEWEAVQKWDGKMPVYMLGGALPFIQVPTQ